MRYSDFLDELAQGIDLLAPRPRAAMFWLLGSGLLTRLQPPEDWAEWFAEARRIGHRFVTTGEIEVAREATWDQARRSTGSEQSQLLNSAIICMSTPLGIAGDPTASVGSWAEHVFFPLMQSVSLEMFEDVAFPGDDEELDDVFAHSAVQDAVEYCRTTVSRLAMAPTPDAHMLGQLLDGAGVLAPPTASPGA